MNVSTAIGCLPGFTLEVDAANAATGQNITRIVVQLLASAADEVPLTMSPRDGAPV